MNFICKHCEKAIEGLSIISDNEIIHRECEPMFLIHQKGNNEINERNELANFLNEKLYTYGIIPKAYFGK